MQTWGMTCVIGTPAGTALSAAGAALAPWAGGTVNASPQIRPAAPVAEQHKQLFSQIFGSEHSLVPLQLIPVPGSCDKVFISRISSSLPTPNQTGFVLSEHALWVQLQL